MGRRAGRVVLAALAWSCTSSGGDGGPTAGTAGGVGAGGSSSVSSGGAGGTHEGTGAGAGSGSGGGAGSGSGASGGAGGTGTAGDPTGSADRPRYLDYVRTDRYAQVVLEIDSVPGFEPRAEAEARLVARLETLLRRPGGVRAVHDQVLEDKGNGYEWTAEELHALAGDTFDPVSTGDEVRIHVMFLNGKHVGPNVTGTVLGLAWSQMHIAMFAEMIENDCAGAGLGLVGPLQDQACVEAHYGVWLHEVGHVVGLVDNGLPMVEPHADAEHGAHDASDQCIMYWAYEGPALFDLISSRLLANGDVGLDFDAACLADIDAAGAP